MSTFNQIESIARGVAASLAPDKVFDLNRFRADAQADIRANTMWGRSSSIYANPTRFQAEAFARINPYLSAKPQEPAPVAPPAPQPQLPQVPEAPSRQDPIVDIVKRRMNLTNPLSSQLPRSMSTSYGSPQVGGVTTKRRSLTSLDSGKEDDIMGLTRIK